MVWVCIPATDWWPVQDVARLCPTVAGSSIPKMDSEGSENRTHFLFCHIERIFPSDTDTTVIVISMHDQSFHAPFPFNSLLKIIYLLVLLTIRGTQWTVNPQSCLRLTTHIYCYSLIFRSRGTPGLFCVQQIKDQLLPWPLVKNPPPAAKYSWQQNLS